MPFHEPFVAILKLHLVHGVNLALKLFEVQCLLHLPEVTVARDHLKLHFHLIKAVANVLELFAFCGVLRFLLLSHSVIFFV